MVALLLLPAGVGEVGGGGGGGCVGGVEARLRGVLLLLLLLLLLLAEVASAAADDGSGLGAFRLEAALFFGVSASGDWFVGWDGLWVGSLRWEGGKGDRHV